MPVIKWCKGVKGGPRKFSRCCAVAACSV